jgi:hypothetical protein
VQPQSSAGTTRSIRGSIFGRTGRSLRKSHPPALAISELDEKNSYHRPQTTQTVASTIAPTIQVTGDSGSARQRSSVRKESHHHHHHHHEKLQKRNDSMSRKKGTSTRSRSVSTARASQLDNTNQQNSLQHTGQGADHGVKPPASSDISGSDRLGDREQGQIGLAVAGETNAVNSQNLTSSRPLPPDSQQMHQKERSLIPAHTGPFNTQDSRLPRISAYSSSTGPVTRFPKDQQRRRRMAILINVWLLIGGFYRKAGLFEDSKAALGEAEILVESMQNETLKDVSAPISVQHAGWGGGKSVGELWGDIFSEVAYPIVRFIDKLTDVLQQGFLSVSESSPYTALGHFESALTNFADHPSAIVGLSNILLDMYNGDLPPLPTSPAFTHLGNLHTPSSSTINSTASSFNPKDTSLESDKTLTTPSKASQGPLGLPKAKLATTSDILQSLTIRSEPGGRITNSKEPTTLQLDRLAARDRAYGLLTELTKLGSGWNNSEAWFALARAYEEGGQPEKAREVLWWCVELEDTRAVRSWTVVGSGGYVL